MFANDIILVFELVCYIIVQFFFFLLYCNFYCVALRCMGYGLETYDDSSIFLAQKIERDRLQRYF